MHRPLSLPLGAAAASLVLCLPVLAQDRVPGGRLLTLGLSTGITATDNADLDEEAIEEVEASTGLSLGLQSLTPTQRFQLGTSTDLRALFVGEEGDDTFEFRDPNGTLLYSRRSRSSELTFEAAFDSREVSEITPLELSSEDLADLEDAEELEDLIASNQVSRDARRLTFDLAATLETRRDSPFGITYSLGVFAERYTDSPDAFEDETRASAGLGLRFDLDEITQATTDIRFVTSDDPQEEDRLSVDVDLTREIGRDQVGASLGVIEDGNETRFNLSANAAREFSTGRLSGSLGVSHAENGTPALIGSLGLARDLSPTQDVRFNLSRQVTRLDGADPGDPSRVRAVTSLSADYGHDITRFWRFGFDARLRQAEDIDGPGEDESFGEISADLSRPLTEDWSISMGVSHRFENSENGIDVTGNTVSVFLNRTFQIPY